MTPRPAHDPMTSTENPFRRAPTGTAALVTHLWHARTGRRRDANRSPRRRADGTSSPARPSEPAAVPVGRAAHRPALFRAVRVPLVLAALYLPGPARADIDLEWRPDTTAVNVGDVVDIGLFAVSDSPTEQLLAGMGVVIAWEPAFLRLVGVDDTGAVPLLFSGFPADPFDLNETIPPQDGDGFYQALAPLGDPVAATPDGTLITTFRFESIAPVSVTVFAILAEGGSPVTQTVVWDGVIPNNPVTGSLGEAQITVINPGDFDFDGDVDLFDAAAFDACAGGPGGGVGATCAPGDFDNDNDVDFHDWGRLLIAFSGG